MRDGSWVRSFLESAHANLSSHCCAISLTESVSLTVTFGSGLLKEVQRDIMGLGLSDQHIVDLGMGNKRLLVTEAMAK